mmetsp:Transcript_7495/g.8958  ORF Transcript_7495/g.8958 Transcript_7495/m.8958 type:complete len:234 (-) Transcript_7495:62-763(-)
MGDPGTDGKHGGTSVLNLDKTTTVGDLDVKRIPSKITGETTSLKSGCDPFIFGKFAILVGKFVDFDKSDSGKHLSQSFGGDRLHGIQGSHGSQIGKLDTLRDGEVLMRRNVVQGPSELVEQKTDCGNHGRTSVLEFGSLEEGTGSFRSVFHGQLVPVVLTDKDRFSKKRSRTEAGDLFFHFKKFRSFLTHANSTGGGGGTGGGSKRRSATDETQDCGSRKLHCRLCLYIYLYI